MMPVRYSVRRRAQNRDASGVRSDYYGHVFFVWGEAAREGSTRFVGQSGAVDSEDTLRFRVRYHEDLRVGDRLVTDDGGEMDVRSVLEVGRRQLQLVLSRSPAGAS